ncbi:unnamed protein product [Rhodiola kirilowii]
MCSLKRRRSLTSIAKQHRFITSATKRRRYALGWVALPTSKPTFVSP